MFPNASAVAKGNEIIGKLVTTKKRKRAEASVPDDDDGGGGNVALVSDLDKEFHGILLAQEHRAPSVAPEFLPFLACAAEDSFLDGTATQGNGQEPAAFRWNCALARHIGTGSQVDEFFTKHTRFIAHNTRLQRLLPYVRGAIGMTATNTRFRDFPEHETLRSEQKNVCPVTGQRLGPIGDDEDKGKEPLGGDVFFVTLSVDSRAQKSDFPGAGVVERPRKIERKSVLVLGTLAVEQISAAMLLCNVYEIAKICAAARHLDMEVAGEGTGEAPKTVAEAVQRLVNDKGENFITDMCKVYEKHMATVLAK